MVVKRSSITHKELTLLLGILVALVVAITLWVKTPDGQQARNDTKHRNTLLPSASKLMRPAFKILVRS